MKSALIRLRREQGLTQKDVADLLGVTQQAVYKLERYDSDPKFSTIRRYANAVGALVEHRVAPDLGQSVALAAPPLWDSISTQSHVVSMVGRRKFSVGREPWSDGSPVHKALVG